MQAEGSEHKPLLRLDTLKRPFSLFNPQTNYDTSPFDGAPSLQRFQTVIQPSKLNYDLIGDADEHGMRWKYDDYTTIDWIHDTIKERKRLRNLKNQKGWRGSIIKYMDASQAWIVLFIIGVLSGTVATFMDIATPFLENVKFGYCNGNFFLHRELCKQNWNSWSSYEWIQILIDVILGLLYASLATTIVSYSPSNDISALYANSEQDQPTIRYTKKLFHAAGSGIPEVKTILGGFVIRGYLGIRTLVCKILALVLTVSSELMVGVQGPLVHICCAIGNITTRLFTKYSRNDAKRREIMSASCAAGVSVAFGAPIGGVLFALEEVSYFFPPKTMWRSFFCALIAAVTIKMLNPFGSGKLVMFQVSYNSDYNALELIPFVILGLFGGAFGGLFIKVTNWIHQSKRKIKDYTFKYALYEVMAISIITTLLSYATRFTRLGNVVFVSHLLNECTQSDGDSALCQYENTTHLLFELAQTFFIKVFLMLITFGIRIPGGVFIPSMVIGATAGRMMGILVQSITSFASSNFQDNYEPRIIPGVYAMVGAAGTLCGVTRMTVSLAVIMFELTGGLTYILPLMTSIMTAKWVADAISRDSIYDSIILKQGYPYLNHKKTNEIKAKTVEDIMTRGGETLDTSCIYRLADIKQKLDKLDGGLAILQNNTIPVGYISQQDLKHALNAIESSLESYSSISIVFHNLGIDRDSPLSYISSGSSSQFDLSHWVDKAPLCVSSISSSDMVLELFVKLGVRSLVVTSDGAYAGMIHKKRMLFFINNSK